MGRYSGEEYETVPPCLAGNHQFNFNGRCHTCRISREEVLRNAFETIVIYGSGESKKVAKDALMKMARGPHPSHVTRMSDSSLFDEVCTNCGAHDEVPGGWGTLALPCSKASTHLA